MSTLSSRNFLLGFGAGFATVTGLTSAYCFYFLYLKKGQNKSGKCPVKISSECKCDPCKCDPCECKSS